MPILNLSKGSQMLVLCSHSLLANIVKARCLPPAFPCYSSGLVSSIVNKNDLCIKDKVLNMSHLYNFLVPLQDLESINQSCELLAPFFLLPYAKKKKKKNRFFKIICQL